MRKRRRLHPIEIAAKNASFDILGYSQQKFKEALNKEGTMKEKDSMLFPITDIFDLAETLANLSDEGLNILKTSLANDYGINLELNKEL